MRGDRGRRERERELRAAGGEPEDWLRLAREAERRGERERGLARALEGLRQHPDSALLCAALPELGFPGAWPCEAGGPDRARCGPFVGPREGIARWRVELPGQPVGEPLVGREGSCWIRCEPEGLVRVSARGEASRVHPSWPSHLPPLLVDDEPRCFDPLLSELGQPPGIEVLRGSDGALFAVEGSRLVCWDPSGLPRWQVVRARGASRRRLTLGRALLAETTTSPMRADLTRKTSVRWLDRRAGTLRHEEQLSGRALSVAYAGEGGWLVSDGQRLRCLAPPSLRWEQHLGDASAPAVGGGRVVLSALNGLRAFDLASGEPLFRRRGLRASHPPLIDAEGGLVLALGGDLLGLDPEGQRRWRLNLGGYGPLGPPVCASPGLVVLTAGRSLVAVA